MLAVDPDTLQTLPCPIEEVYENGIQDVQCAMSLSRDHRVIRTLWVTPNHHILTENGLQEAGEIENGTSTAYPEDLYFAGISSNYAYLVGLILPTLESVNGRTRFYLSSRNYRLAVRHCLNTKLDGYIKRKDNGICEAYGALGTYLNKWVFDKTAFFKEVPYTWGNSSLRAFLSGWLPHKMLFYGGLITFKITCPFEKRFLNGALKSLGCATDFFLADTKRRRNLSLYSPFDVLRLVHKLKLPKWLNQELLNWATPRASYCNNSDLKFLKTEHYWKRISKHNPSLFPKEAMTYDLKLAGGNNLYIANGFIVGNSGKTEAGTIEAYWFMTGTHPYRKDIEVPNRGRILVESLDAFEQDILPKFQKWAPNFDQWKKIVGHQGKWAGAVLPNGSRFDVFTFDQKSKKLEGTSIRWCWTNEPAPKSHIIASTRGLVDQDGDLWFTLTPLSEPYIFEDYVAKSKKDSATIGLHTATIWDNPWLKKSAVKAWVETLDPDERRAREKGEFAHLQGRVFKTFSPDIHVIPSVDWVSSWPLCIGIDPHLRKNQIAMFVGRTNKGLYVAVDEIEYDGDDLVEFGLMIADRVNEQGYEIQAICADSFLQQPDMVRKDIEPRKVLDEVFEKFDLPRITIANKKNTRDAFITEMRRLLTPIPRPEYGLKDGKIISYPGFVVMDRCTGLIKDFANYVFKNTRRPELTGESEEPIKKWDDRLDALKYGMLADPSFEERIRKPRPPILETYGARIKKDLFKV